MSSQFTGAAATGLEVRGSGSTMHVAQCTVESPESCSILSEQELALCGVAVRDEAVAEIDRLTVSSGVIGVLVHGESEIRMSNSKLSKTQRSCMSVATGSNAVVKNCSLSESTEQHGLMVRDECSTVQAYSCKFFRNPQGGAAVFARGYLKANMCETQGNLGAGFWAQLGATLELNACSSFNDAVGAGVQLSSTILAKHTSVRHSKQSGFLVSDYCSGNFTSCSASDGSLHGATIDGTQATATLTQCTFTASKLDGVHVGDAARAVLDKLSLIHISEPTRPY